MHATSITPALTETHSHMLFQHQRHSTVCQAVPWKRLLQVRNCQDALMSLKDLAAAWKQVYLSIPHCQMQVSFSAPSSPQKLTTNFTAGNMPVWSKQCAVTVQSERLCLLSK